MSSSVLPSAPLAASQQALPLKRKNTSDDDEEALLAAMPAKKADMEASHDKMATFAVPDGDDGCCGEQEFTECERSVVEIRPDGSVCKTVESAVSQHLPDGSLIQTSTISSCTSSSSMVGSFTTDESIDSLQTCTDKDGFVRDKLHVVTTNTTTMLEDQEEEEEDSSGAQLSMPLVPDMSATSHVARVPFLPPFSDHDAVALQTLSKKQLQVLLNDMGASTKGNKPELVARIIEEGSAKATTTKCCKMSCGNDVCLTARSTTTSEDIIVDPLTGIDTKILTTEVVTIARGADGIMDRTEFRSEEVMTGGLLPTNEGMIEEGGGDKAIQIAEGSGGELGTQKQVHRHRHRVRHADGSVEETTEEEVIQSE